MRKLMDKGLGLNYLIKTLELLKVERSASFVYRHSPYKHKKSYLRLLRSLQKNHLIIKRTHFTKRRNKTGNVYYSISFQGEMLLCMIKDLSLMEKPNA